MKNAQLLTGLLIGTALGLLISGLSSTSLSSLGLGKDSVGDRAAIETIVRETLDGEGKRIMDAVQKFQSEQRAQQTAGAVELLKDEAFRNDIYNDKDVAFVGPADSTRVVAEFFDYNCPACKMQYKALSEVIAKDKDVKVVFHEFPIFGPQSDTNSKIGLGVWHVAPKKYLAFHEKMMSGEGRADEATAYGYVKAIGVNVAKVKAFVASPEAEAGIQKSRGLGQKMGIQGTPSIVIGQEMIPHAVQAAEIEQKLGITQ